MDIKIIIIINITIIASTLYKAHYVTSPVGSTSPALTHLIFTIILLSIFIIIIPLFRLRNGGIESISQNLTFAKQRQDIKRLSPDVL